MYQHSISFMQAPLWNIMWYPPEGLLHFCWNLNRRQSGFFSAERIGVAFIFWWKIVIWWLIKKENAEGKDPSPLSLSGRSRRQTVESKKKCVNICRKTAFYRKQGAALLFPKQSWKHCCVLLQNGWRAEAGLSFVLAKSSRLMWTQATKSFLPIVLLYWYEGVFLLPKLVWWPGSLCPRPFSSLCLFVNGTERPGRQPGCPCGMGKSKALFWLADSMYWFFVDELFWSHPWQEKNLSMQLRVLELS